jgi:hypothetical protein
MLSTTEYEHTGVAMVTLSNRHFQTNTVLYYRGGFMWVKKADMRCCASLMVGFTEHQALAWMQQDERATGTPFFIMHSVLFDIPLVTSTAAPVARQELTSLWLRITDQMGHVFGVRTLEFFAVKIDSTVPEYNACMGIDNVRDMVAEKKENAEWSEKAEWIRCRYLSGLEPEAEGDGFGTDKVKLCDWSLDWDSEIEV